MDVTATLLGIGCGLAALALTLILPIQRGRLSNQMWDLITFALWLGAAYWGYPFDGLLTNLVAGAVAGFAAVLIRDFRLWLVRFQDRAYGRGHRYYWYGRARSAWGGRRRRRW